MKWLASMGGRLVGALAEFSPGCKAAARLQSEALDHKLTWRQRVGLRIHVILCKWCGRYGKQIAFLHEAVRARPDEIAQSVPQQLSKEARARISKQLRANSR